jgi:CelD/BcsL family acetyltransferase involved in cellulose biosynthesis
MSSILSEWTDPPFELQPVADAVGPFPDRPFLETWWRRHGGTDRLAIVTTDTGTMPLRVSGEVVKFCGNANLTDYHSPLGDPASAIAAAAAAFPGQPFSFNSLPEEAADALLASLGADGHSSTRFEDAITAVIDLDTGPGWLDDLRKKDRHEIRRKQRRFVETLGDCWLERRSDAAAAAIFADMHRQAAGTKARFMSEEQEAFFADLVTTAGATVDLLSSDKGPVAAAFGFVRPDGYYLYNSAYAEEASAASPGIVLLAALIDSLIADGVPRLDLLKGDEAYKFRFGAQPRQLFRLQGRFR